MIVNNRSIDERINCRIARLFPSLRRSLHDHVFVFSIIRKTQCHFPPLLPLSLPASPSGGQITATARIYGVRGRAGQPISISPILPVSFHDSAGSHKRSSGNTLDRLRILSRAGQPVYKRRRTRIRLYLTGLLVGRRTGLPQCSRRYYAGKTKESRLASH